MLLNDYSIIYDRIVIIVYHKLTQIRWIQDRRVMSRDDHRRRENMMDSEKDERKDTSTRRTDHLPITRRSMLQGAAAVGPIAGLATAGDVVESASAMTEDTGTGTVTSPDGTVEATVEVGPSDRLDDDLPSGRVASFTVRYDGTTVIEPSPLGITTYMGQFVTSLSLEDTSVETIIRRYETVGGDESGEQTLQAHCGTLTFSSPNGTLQLKLFVANTGRFPKPPKRSRITQPLSSSSSRQSPFG